MEEEIVMEPEASKPADLNREYVQKLLNGCLKHGLSALCKEKPEEPIKWLAHWLLENNPHQPRVHLPEKAAVETQPATHQPGKRAGSVLKAHKVLVPDAVERSENEHVQYPMPGAPGFVHDTAVRISLVGPCSEEGVGHVLEAMQHGASGLPTSVVWISLRNEVVTYIAGKPYALRDADAPLQSAEIDMNDGEYLQMTERELKANVEEEVANECGRLALHGAGGLRASWASVTLGSIRTPAEVVQEAGQRAFGVAGKLQVRFECMPLGSQRALQRQDITSLLELLHDVAPGGAVVVSHLRGSPVATMVAVAASMAQRMRASGGEHPVDLVTREPLPIARKWNPERGLLEEFAAVQELVKALDTIYLDAGDDGDGCERLGELAKALCDDTMDRFAGPVHLRRMVMECAREARAAGDQDGPLTKAFNEVLWQYLVLVGFAAMVLHGATFARSRQHAEKKQEQQHRNAVLDAIDRVSSSLVLT